MADPWEAFRNPDGTYNGIKALAQISGLSEAEIAWTADRLRALLKAGKSKDEAKAIVRAEAVSRPWACRG